MGDGGGMGSGMHGGPLWPTAYNENHGLRLNLKAISELNINLK